MNENDKEELYTSKTINQGGKMQSVRMQCAGMSQVDRTHLFRYKW